LSLWKYRELQLFAQTSLSLTVDSLDGLDLSLVQEVSLAAVMESATIICHCRFFQLIDNQEPVLKNEQKLKLSPISCDLDLYIRYPTNPYALSDKAPLAAFGSFGRALRIGSRLFLREGVKPSFYPVTDLDTGSESRKVRYFEDVACHSSFFALTSRTKLSAQEVNGDFDHLHHDDEGEIRVIDSDSDGSWGGEAYPVVEDSDSSEWLEFASDDDSVSEGSSIYPNEDGFEDDNITPWADYHIDYSDSDDSDCGSNMGVPDPTFDSDDSDSDDEGPTENTAAFGRHVFREETDEDWGGLPQYFSDQVPSPSKPQATVTIFDSSSGTPELLFRKQFPLRCKIYASPPVFHPKRKLLVWPLADGDILFIDYENRTSFSRRLWPTTPFSKAPCNHSKSYRSSLFNTSSTRLHSMLLLPMRTIHAHCCPGGSQARRQNSPKTRLPG